MESAVATLISLTRWLLAPIYLGLGVLLALLVFAFARELLAVAMTIHAVNIEDLILATLTLVDLSLIATLIVMIVLLGFDNFVSRSAVSREESGPVWMDKLDPGGLKLKLSAAIVAISSIHLLKSYLRLGETPPEALPWLVGLHLTFVATAILMALADRLRSDRRDSEPRGS